jgi:hypothetical protein
MAPSRHAEFQGGCEQVPIGLVIDTDENASLPRRIILSHLMISRRRLSFLKYACSIFPSNGTTVSRVNSEQACAGKGVAADRKVTHWSNFDQREHELIAERYERRSLLITANQPFSGWNSIFPDPGMTVAAIDRLVHHSTIFELNVESYRRRTASDKQSARRRQSSTTTIQEDQP